MIFETFSIRQVYTSSIDGQHTVAAKHQQRLMLLLKRFSQYDDQIDPERKWHSGSSLNERFFRCLGGVVAIRMVFALAIVFLFSVAAFFRTPPFAILLCLANLR